MSSSNQITCTNCGKISGTGVVGSHWICTDCKADELEPAVQPDFPNSAPLKDEE